jgi:hypothetical protein
MPIEVDAPLGRCVTSVCSLEKIHLELYQTNITIENVSHQLFPRVSHFVLALDREHPQRFTRSSLPSAFRQIRHPRPEGLQELQIDRL